jgi:hypothetical protein
LSNVLDQPRAGECLLNCAGICSLCLSVGKLLNKSTSAILMKLLDQASDSTGAAQFLHQSACNCGVISAA